MYYITNQNNQIIAADDTFLNFLSVESIEELLKKIMLDDIQLDLSTTNTLTIRNNQTTNTCTFSRISLSGILGDLELISITPIETKIKSKTPLHEDITVDNDALFKNKNVPTVETLSTSEDNPLALDYTNDLLDLKIDNEKKEILDIEDPNKETSLSLDGLDNTIGLTLPTDNEQNDDLFDLKEDNQKHSVELESPTIQDESNDLLDLTLPNTTIDAIEDIQPEEETTSVKEILDTTPIIIMVDEISQNIGISNEDYNTFLNEYIDTAITLENDLKSNDNDTKRTAISTLVQLANVLELPEVNNIISQLDNTEVNDTENIIETFYQTLARLTTQQTEKPLFTQELEEEQTEEELTQTEESNLTSFGTLDLTEIKPIPFHFQLEEAANDLSLPVELIAEFVDDFIVQANEETPKILAAYEEGSLITIQQIAHMLKGAASNLRIHALSDTLYEIQFCEDPTKLEKQIKSFWAHFLSFEQHIKTLSN